MATPLNVDTLIHSKWILPIRPENICLENHSIALDQGNIVEILDTQQAKQKYSAKETLVLDQHVVMPGLINAHGHSAMCLFRGLADDLPLMEWLNDHIWPAEGQWVSESFVKDGTNLAIAEMLLSGTTCFSDMYFYPEIIADCANKAGIRVQACAPILDFPTMWGSGPDEYIEKTLKIVEQYRDNDLVSVAFGPHAPYTVSDEPLQKIAEIAKEKSIPVQIHLHETAHEVDEAEKNMGKRPTQRLKELGLLGKDSRLQAVHVTQINEQDIDILSEANASVLHCPESNLKLASGFCPSAKLMDAGINLALGTDGAASNNDLDMFGEMRTAALLGKAVSQDASALDAHTMLEIATLNGAKALGIDSFTGSLEAGKSADLIAINMNTPNCQPIYDVASQVVYSANATQVSHVWVMGKAKVIGGELTSMNQNELIAKALEWATKIASSDKPSETQNHHE